MYFLQRILSDNLFPAAADIDSANNLIESYRNNFQEILKFPNADKFLMSIFGNSPFLSQLILKNQDFIKILMNKGPEKCFEEIQNDLQTKSIHLEKELDVINLLRKSKQKISLLVAISDITCYWNLEQVTKALSDFAELAINITTDFLISQSVKSGDLILDNNKYKNAESGFIVIAMGKLGAHELNYSSDVDLILFYDPELVNYQGTKSIQNMFINIGKKIVSIMQDRNENGYVFRIDLRLRPDPSSTPIAVSTNAAMHYYESVGQNWERMSFIKARAIAGDIKAGKNLLKHLTPFVWRKYLDFAMIEDIHSVKRQIEAKNIGESQSLYNYNIKLGRGGIREIEFFATIQQIIWGGREISVRCSQTCEAIIALRKCNKVTKKAENELIEAYIYLRNLEHCLQMVADQQTHTLPNNEEKMHEIAIFMHYQNKEDFIKDLRFHLLTVQKHYIKLGGSSPSLGTGEGSLVFTGSDNDPETVNNLQNMGFKNGDSISSIIRGWHHGRNRATNNKRARELLTELTPAILKAMSNTEQPDTAFIKFNNFLKNTPAGIQLFSLFLQHPPLIELVTEIMGSYPYLADNLSRKPVLLEYVLSQDFMDPVVNVSELKKRLRSMLKTAMHYEDVLNITRHWTHDRQFRIGVHLIKKFITPEEAREKLSNIAETALSELLYYVEKEFEKVHGTIENGSFIVVALGKLGSHSLGFGSDIDLIFVYDFPEDSTGSNGKLPLSVNDYYSRLSRRYISAFSALTSEGRLYEIDTRLRPSGKDSPVASTFQAFNKYYSNNIAWTWEYLALTRARVIAGDQELSNKVSKVIKESLCQKRDKDQIKQDIISMNERIHTSFDNGNHWNLKYAKGGIVDLEFIAQYLQLLHAHENNEILDTNTIEAFIKLRKAGFISPDMSKFLIKADRLLLDLQSILRLTSGNTSSTNIHMSEAIKSELTRLSPEDTFSEIEENLLSTQNDIIEIFNHNLS